MLLLFQSLFKTVYLIWVEVNHFLKFTILLIYLFLFDLLFVLICIHYGSLTTIGVCQEFFQACE